jgi:hypothetical protein
MRAIFIAHGPAFATAKVIAPFDNVDVYPLLAHLLGVPPEIHDGNFGRTRAALRAPTP